MNKNTTRVLAVAVLTGGFTIFGATAANAIDLPDLGGSGSGGLLGNGGLLGTGIDLGGTTAPTPPPATPPTTDHGLLGGGGLLGTGIDLGGSTSEGGSILDDLDVSLPVDVNGLNLQVLPTGEHGLSLGDGLLVDTGATNADILSELGIDTSGLLGDHAVQNAVVGVPLDISNTWVSILGNEPSGIVVVPNVVGGVTAELDGIIDGVIDVPIDISCTSVTVLSDYENECAGTTPGDDNGGLLGGDLLGGDLLGGDLLGGDVLDGDLIDLDGDVPVTVDDLTLNVLDGDVLGDGLALGDDGILVDLGDDVTDVGADLGLGDLLGVVAGAPIDLSGAWISVLGEDPNGIVIVPDLTIDLSLITGGLISSEILAPITLDCVTITILSDYERDCGTSVIEEEPVDPEDPTDPTDPTDPELPVEPETPILTPVPGGENGADNNGGNDGTEGITDPCAVVPASATTGLAVESEPTNVAFFGAAALAGALAALALMLIGRRLGRQQQ
jgi:hypothetical protein